MFIFHLTGHHAGSETGRDRPRVTQAGSGGVGIQTPLWEAPELSPDSAACLHGPSVWMHTGVAATSPLGEQAHGSSPCPGAHLLSPASGLLRELPLLPEIHSPLGLPHPSCVGSNVTPSKEPSQPKWPPHPRHATPLPCCLFLTALSPA